ncbi:helix-turn-helix domain-containing protein [Neobacillus cucumis]|uniref:helix-turn-helix domain-containing protein n=1 Tax=Neobacillus cucumis TaxID=1740721 RepID=UPI0035F383E8
MPRVVVQLVDELQEIMTIGEICDHLRVSRSSYYRWKKNQNVETKKDIRDKRIGELCKLHKYRYGYHKIASI